LQGSLQSDFVRAFPHQAALILQMTNPDPRLRPSATDLVKMCFAVVVYKSCEAPAVKPDIEEDSVDCAAAKCESPHLENEVKSLLDRISKLETALGLKDLRIIRLEAENDRLRRHIQAVGVDPNSFVVEEGDDSKASDPS
jgi:hypothetical protein